MEATSEAFEEAAGEEEMNPLTVDTTVTLIVLLLIFLTIAFESIKEYLEEAVERSMKPCIEKLFGEMTVLGFLSIFTFCFTKLGFFEQLSTSVFGEEEHEALLETFEFVHYMLFFIMIFFVMSVLLLVKGATTMERKWYQMDQKCQHRKQSALLDRLEASGLGGRYNLREEGLASFLLKSVGLSACCRNPAKDYVDEWSLFRGLRTEFVMERALEPPHSPNSTHKIADDFDYGRYLGVCLAQEMAHVIHLSPTAWYVLAALTVVYYGLMFTVQNKIKAFAWIWTASGWLLLFIGNAFDYHIRCILEQLAAPPRGIDHTNESTSLLGESTAPLPAWTSSEISDECRENGFTKQDMLYWRGRSGPRAYRILFQIQLVYTTAYISLLVLSFIQHMFEVSSLQGAVLYTILSLYPAFVLVTKYPSLAANMTMASTFGVHQRPQAISQVIREEKMDRIVRSLVVMYKLEKAAQSKFSLAGDSGSHGAYHAHNPVTHRRGRSEEHYNGDDFDAESPELLAVSKAFDALDISGDGKIQSDEVRRIFEALGVGHTNEDHIRAMVAILDKNVDGSITKDEFLSFYLKHVLAAEDGSHNADPHHFLHELAHNLYHRFDRNGNGQITLAEFKSVLDSFSVEFTVNEIGNLVNELDEHDDGTVGEHEFHRLLQNHSHLFANRRQSWQKFDFQSLLE